MAQTLLQQISDAIWWLHQYKPTSVDEEGPWPDLIPLLEEIRDRDYSSFSTLSELKGDKVAWIKKYIEITGQGLKEGADAFNKLYPDYVPRWKAP